ncbi:helix-turn-helix transcriptional regulator [Shinella zoogloeoides]|uniref:AlpA family phage regulatory protein n=1 Tax=Shinella zoogloeoides TaxID=352475 RepID=A0A6N8TJM6_SHIZO|nr:AlpA family phage regulatory protein [Shinella zoogloeoides]MXO03139.1 AlpA family phage regulatory protein [Shinella zoogloeoides]UEX81868.1 AlpA family phage regulatory protein [Shinella zoogloeoides]
MENKINRLLRLKEIIAPKGPIPISRSSWLKKVGTGEYPRPVKLGPRTTVWREQDIVALIRRLETEAGHDV